MTRFVVVGNQCVRPIDKRLNLCRKAYYRIIAAVAEAKPIQAFTGFGLYDRRVVELLRQTGGPYPYVRGLVSEFGLPISTIPFTKAKRQHEAEKRVEEPDPDEDWREDSQQSEPEQDRKDPRP